MSKRSLTIVALMLSTSLLLYSLHLPLVNASAGSMAWGSPMAIQQHILIGGTEEILRGQYCYVFTLKQNEVEMIPESNWTAFIAGDLSSLASEIETELPGSEVVWVQVAWDDSEGPIWITGMPYMSYKVTGFRVEALCRNINAGMTGLEIAAIIIAATFFVFVAGLTAALIYMFWRVIAAAESLGPLATIGVGLILILVVLFGLLLVLGVGFSYAGKKRSVKIGKTNTSFFSWRTLQ